MIELHEFGKIELRFLEELDLSDDARLKREDFFAFVLNLLSDRFVNAM